MTDDLLVDALVLFTSAVQAIKDAADAGTGVTLSAEQTAALSGGLAAIAEPA